jgi:hypothetical protein
MTPNIIRQLWVIVESTHAATILRLDDASLVRCLTEQVALACPLHSDEMAAVNGYVQMKLPLIRDLASSRHMSWAG